MSEHMYKVIELVGTSPESWERAAATAVEEAAKHLSDLRIGEGHGDGSTDLRRKGCRLLSQSQGIVQVPPQ